jgi:hypothetical protein
MKRALSAPVIAAWKQLEKPIGHDVRIVRARAVGAADGEAFALLDAQGDAAEHLVDQAAAFISLGNIVKLYH